MEVTETAGHAMSIASYVIISVLSQLETRGRFHLQ